MEKTVEGSGQTRPTAQQIASDAERIKEMEAIPPAERPGAFGLSDKIMKCLDHKDSEIPSILRSNFPGYTRADLKELLELANDCKLSSYDDLE